MRLTHNFVHAYTHSYTHTRCLLHEEVSSALLYSITAGAPASVAASVAGAVESVLMVACSSYVGGADALAAGAEAASFLSEAGVLLYACTRMCGCERVCVRMRKSMFRSMGVSVGAFSCVVMPCHFVIVYLPTFVCLHIHTHRASHNNYMCIHVYMYVCICEHTLVSTAASRVVATSEPQTGQTMNFG